MSAPLASPLKIKNVQGDEKHRLESIADNMILDNTKYQWKDVGFTQCSESCLGNILLFKKYISKRRRKTRVKYIYLIFSSYIRVKKIMFYTEI